MKTKMLCPACAEEILVAAKKCRFCGQEISDAHRMGFPGFYEDIVRFGFGPSFILTDYEKVCSGTFGSFSSRQPLSGCLHGTPTDLNLVRNILVRLYERVEELAKIENLDGIYGARSNFSQIASIELRHIFIFAEYFRNCAFVTEVASIPDQSDAISTYRMVLEDLRRLHELASTLGPEAKSYQEVFLKDIESVEERIRASDASQRKNLVLTTPTALAPPPTQTNKNWLLYCAIGVIAVIVVFSMR